MYSARKVLGALAGSALVLGSVAFVTTVAGAPGDKYTVKSPAALASPNSRDTKAGRRSRSAPTNADVSDRRQSCNDPGLQGRYSCQREACPGRRQDGESPLGSEEEPVLPRHDGARRPARRGLHGEGQQAVRLTAVDGATRFQVRRRLRHFQAGTTADTPPQGNDAKCGAACHTLVKNRDFVFTEYGHR